MQMITQKFNGAIIEIPKTCPYCGVGNNPTTSVLGGVSRVKNEEASLQSFIHHCAPCGRGHITIQKKFDSQQNYQCLLTHPKIAIADIDPLLLEHAPNFSKFYSESLEAEREQLFNLAAIGLRASIEALVKDFALDFDLDSKENIAKLSFNNAIDKYIKDDEFINGSIHTIRKIGNDFTHWDNQNDIDYFTLKSYVEIIIQIFKGRFMMKYRPV